MKAIVLRFPRKVIAKRMGSDIQHIYTLINRKHNPNLKTLSRLAAATEISIHDWVDYFCDPSIEIVQQVIPRGRRTKLIKT